MFGASLWEALSSQVFENMASGEVSCLPLLFHYYSELSNYSSTMINCLFCYQSHWQGGRLTCPYHLCHTCSSDNPQDSHSRTPNDKIARCVRCPSSYHTSTSCLPAGSVILTGSQIVCPKHYKAPHPPLNAAWCFLCTRGGSLICCDTCPTSFHLECLGKFVTNQL